MSSVLYVSLWFAAFVPIAPRPMWEESANGLTDPLIAECAADVLYEVPAHRVGPHQALIDRRRYVEVDVYAARLEFDFQHLHRRVVIDRRQAGGVDWNSIDCGLSLWRHATALSTVLYTP